MHTDKLREMLVRSDYDSMYHQSALLLINKQLQSQRKGIGMPINMELMHLFQRRTRDNEFAYVGLLDTGVDVELEQDELYIVNSIDPSKVFIDALPEHENRRIKKTVDRCKREAGSSLPTVGEYLKLPCWPSVEDIGLHCFRVLKTEDRHKYIVFGASKCGFSRSHPDESWYFISPNKITLLEKTQPSMTSTNGYTLNQVLTEPVWMDAGGQKWSLSYNCKEALMVYQEMNALAVDLVNNNISEDEYNDRVLKTEESKGIYLNCRNSCSNREFLTYIAMRENSAPKSLVKNMLTSAEDKLRLDNIEKQGMAMVLGGI